MREEYEKWLMSQLQIEEGDEGYSELCRIMGRTPFLPFLEMDINRGDDGMALREEWADGLGKTDDETVAALYELDCEIGGGTCSMLELMVVMCRRFCYEMMDSPYEAGIFKWFQELIGNCGLDEWTDKEVLRDPDRAEEAIAELLGTIIFHRFGWDGEGSMFPLRYIHEDQREMDILTQMNNYIAENYDIC